MVETGRRPYARERFPAPLSRSRIPGAPMNCHASSRLYVRANGTVPCNCDTGESTTLFRPPLDDLDSFDYVEDVFNGPVFRQLRESLRSEVPPIEACRSCFFFHPSEALQGYGQDGRVDAIEHIQIESSFLCGVDCDACVLRETRTDPARSALGDGPYEMPLELFQKLFDDVRRAGLPVREIAFCGRGEPLLHPQFTEMMEYARRVLPDTYYSVVTSGNAPFSHGILDVNHMSVSIDGGFPDSYEIYRKGGNLPRVLRFLEQVVEAREREGRGPTVEWKYILFEHNDSDEEILHAQKLAQDIGVDAMMFVLTHTWNRSTKYTEASQIAELPLFQAFEGAKTTFSNVNEESENVSHWEEIGQTPRAERFQR